MLSRPFFRGAGSVGVLSIAVRSAGGAVARGFFSSSQTSSTTARSQRSAPGSANSDATLLDKQISVVYSLAESESESESESGPIDPLRCLEACPQ
jgi:hypothetical protein